MNLPSLNFSYTIHPSLCLVTTKTIEIYTFVNTQNIQQIKNPFDDLYDFT